MQENINTITAWYAAFKTRYLKAIEQILADNISFYSPVVHVPYNDKKSAIMLLGAAATVIANGKFQYVKKSQMKKCNA